MCCIIYVGARILDFTRKNIRSSRPSDGRYWRSGRITFERKSYRDRVWNERQTIQSKERIEKSYKWANFPGNDQVWPVYDQVTTPSVRHIVILQHKNRFIWCNNNGSSHSHIGHNLQLYQNFKKYEKCWMGGVELWTFLEGISSEMLHSFQINSLHILNSGDLPAGQTLCPSSQKLSTISEGHKKWSHTSVSAICLFHYYLPGHYLGKALFWIIKSSGLLTYVSPLFRKK